jgi:hypothetical protein
LYTLFCFGFNDILCHLFPIVLSNIELLVNNLQLVIMPLLTPALGEARLLAVGLFFTCVHVSTLYSIQFQLSPKCYFNQNNVLN